MIKWLTNISLRVAHDFSFGNLPGSDFEELIVILSMKILRSIALCSTRITAVNVIILG